MESDNSFKDSESNSDSDREFDHSFHYPESNSEPPRNVDRRGRSAGSNYSRARASCKSHNSHVTIEKCCYLPLQSLKDVRKCEKLLKTKETRKKLVSSYHLQFILIF